MFGGNRSWRGKGTVEVRGLQTCIQRFFHHTTVRPEIQDRTCRKDQKSSIMRFFSQNAQRDSFQTKVGCTRNNVGPTETSLPPQRHSREGDRVVSIYNIRVGATAIHQMPKGELVDCQIQPPAGEEKSARCLRRSEAVVCHTILVAAYPFS